MSSTDYWEKDPNSTLDYKFDWSDWMTEGDTITNIEMIVSPTNHSSQLVVEEASVDTATSIVTVWLSQGRKNTKYKLTCRITTANGRIQDHTRTVKVLNQ